LAGLQGTINQMNQNLVNMQMLNQYVTVDTAAENGLVGPNVTFHGVNVHIVNNSGTTGMPNGLGNLILGYDELPFDAMTHQSLPLQPDDRNGSHNLVIGPSHRFTSFSSGGFVTGINNTLNAPWSSILSGYSDIANGSTSIIVGGSTNSTSVGAQGVVLIRGQSY
jgi:hypothetical protein